jgi:hypothetical protein
MYADLAMSGDICPLWQSSPLSAITLRRNCQIWLDRLDRNLECRWTVKRKCAEVPAEEDIAKQTMIKQTSKICVHARFYATILLLNVNIIVKSFKNINLTLIISKND